MEVLTTLLFCALCLFIYIAYKKNDEVIRLKEQLREQETSPSQKFLDVSSKGNGSYSQSVKEYKSNSEKIFVRVIFEKDAAKSYDYLVGNFDVKVGDFVVVRTGNINSGNAKFKSAQVIYISAPGEISSYAKTPIIKKADYNKW